MTPRCKCSHGASVHTGGYGRCWFLSCACNEYRDPAEYAACQARHPAGKALTELPQTADIYDYLRLKGEL